MENSVWNSVENSVWNSVENSVENSVWNSVENSVWNSVGNTKLTHYWFCYESLGWSSGWVSFYDYFRRVGIVKTPEFDKYVEYLQSGLFMTVFQDGLAVVCRRPKKLLRDERERMHSETEAAIEWRDGFKLYYLFGIEFDEKLWKKVVDRKLKFKEMMEISNMEQRMAALKVLGAEYLLEQGKAQLIEKTTRGNELFLLKGVFSRYAYFLKYTCPSTGRVYVSGVDPEVGKQGSADACMAWKHHMTMKEYSNIIAEA